MNILLTTIGGVEKYYREQTDKVIEKANKEQTLTPFISVREYVNKITNT